MVESKSIGSGGVAVGSKLGDNITSGTLTGVSPQERKRSGGGREGEASGEDITALEKHRISPAITRYHMPCTNLSATCPSNRLISCCDSF
jgi:hypothetical protein